MRTLAALCRFSRPSRDKCRGGLGGGIQEEVIVSEFSDKAPAKEQIITRPLVFCSQLIQELVNSETEFVKEVDLFTLLHLKQADSANAPAEVSSQKDAIFRNIDDIKSFHSR